MLYSVNIASIIYVPLFFLFLVFPLCIYYTFCSCPTVFFCISFCFSLCSLCFSVFAVYIDICPSSDIPSSVMSNSTSESIKTLFTSITMFFFGGGGVWGQEGNASQVVLVVNNPPDNAGDRRCRFDPWVGKIPWRWAWQPTQVVLPGESHGQRS